MKHRELEQRTANAGSMVSKEESLFASRNVPPVCWSPPPPAYSHQTCCSPCCWPPAGMYNTFWGIFSPQPSVKITPCLPPAVFAADMNFIGIQCNGTVPPFVPPNGPYRCEFTLSLNK